MKVYDIIVEAPTNAAAYLAVLNRITSAAEIDKALGYLARLVKGSKFSADEIADSWVASANKAGLSLEEIVVMGERELRAAGVEEALIKKALQKADAIEPGIYGKVTARISADMSTGEWLGKSLEKVTGYANILGLGIPIGSCIASIGKEYATYQQSKKTPADYETFQHSSQYWINKCVGEVAAVIVGNWFIAKVISIPGGWAGLTGAKQLGPIYLGLTRAAQITFMTSIMSDEGRNWLARMFVADLLFNVPVAVGGRIEQQPVQKVIRDTVGGWTTRALGWVTDQAQKLTDPAAAAKKTADAEVQAKADKAKADAAYQGVSKGREYDAYGMPIQRADPRGKITPLN
jgi:hypothetical protein